MPVTIVEYSPTTHFIDSVYIDTNLLINARNRASRDYSRAASLLGHLISQGTTLYVSSLVFDELWWVTLRIYYKHHTGNKLNQRILKNNPQIIGRYGDLVRRTMDKLLRIPNFRLISYNPNNIKFIQRVYNLFVSKQLAPRDSFHLGLTINSDIRGFATGDSDFDNLNLPDYHLTIYKY